MQFSNSTVPADPISALLLAGVMPGGAPSSPTAAATLPDVGTPGFDELFAELAPSPAPGGMADSPDSAGVESPFGGIVQEPKTQIAGGVGAPLEAGEPATIATALRWTAAHRVQWGANRADSNLETPAGSISATKGSGTLTTTGTAQDGAPSTHFEVGEDEAVLPLESSRTAATRCGDGVLAAEVAGAGIPNAVAATDPVASEESLEQEEDAANRDVFLRTGEHGSSTAEPIVARQIPTSRQAWPHRAADAEVGNEGDAQPEQVAVPSASGFTTAEVSAQRAVGADSQAKTADSAALREQTRAALSANQAGSAVSADARTSNARPRQSLGTDALQTSAIADATVAGTGEGGRARESLATSAFEASAGGSRVEIRSPISGASAAEANFADSGERRTSDENASNDSSGKSFLTSEDKGPATRRRSVGIDVAKPATTMSARFATTTAHLPHPDAGYTVSATVETASSAQVATSSATTGAEQVTTAHHAVEAVLHAVEQFSSRDQKVVQLQFSVGEADLKVRVELHANEVRTTFRTDSSELRAALSQEWQSVTAGNADRAVKLAPAVFTGTDASNSNAFAGDASSRQRDQGGRREAEMSFFSAHPSRGGASASNSMPETPAARTSHSVSAGSLHLHTFA